ncbi:MAG: 30S ribosomal protein S15 [Rickettsiaceae bacterium]|nr:30S ribosomal protein S15 [Rickettsiaceae bacterium]
MSITAERRTQLIKDFALHENDKGSVEVQCAILTDRIRNLTEHCKIHKHDHSTRRGLLKMVSTRKRLMKYLTNNNLMDRYRDLLKRLDLRK